MDAMLYVVFSKTNLVRHGNVFTSPTGRVCGHGNVIGTIKLQVRGRTHN